MNITVTPQPLTELTIETPDNVRQTFESYQELETAFEASQVNPENLKTALEKHLNLLLASVREEFADEKMVKITQLAYPSNLTGAVVVEGRMRIIVGVGFLNFFKSLTL